MQEMPEYEERVVSIKRVAKVVKGGRRFSFSALVVVGNGAGSVGYGMGKAGEVPEAIGKASRSAKKGFVQFPLVEGRTIAHEVVGEFGAARVIMRPAAPGTGVLAGGAMRAVLEAAGVKDVIGKSLGSSNPHNVVKATVKAMIEMRMPHEVAKQRGVEVAKVFHG